MKDKPQGYAHLTAKIDELKRELAEAVAKEREACAQVVDDFGDEYMCDAHQLAKIIRERGTK